MGYVSLSILYTQLTVKLDQGHVMFRGLDLSIYSIKGKTTRDLNQWTHAENEALPQGVWAFSRLSIQPAG